MSGDMGILHRTKLDSGGMRKATLSLGLSASGSDGAWVICSVAGADEVFLVEQLYTSDGEAKMFTPGARINGGSSLGVAVD
jgi:hypothetical protein